MNTLAFLDHGRLLASTSFSEGIREPSHNALITLPFPGTAGPLWQGIPLATTWAPAETPHFPSPPFQPLQVEEVVLHPSRDRFFQRVERALQALEKGMFSKVVVARAVEFRLSRTPKSMELFAQLRKAREPHETAFGIAHPSGMFLGLTPERLFRIRGNTLEVDLLAGTAPSPEELDRPHLVEEHALVGEGVKTQLNGLVEEVQIQPLAPLKAGPVWHRRARFTARLRNGVSWITVLHHLHPTPALAGHPRDAALRWIEEDERGLRGLYGGVVGYVNPEEVVCFVAIRSALVRGSRLILFAGGGVVRGHTPEELWEETSSKLRRVASLFIPDAPLPV